MTVNSVYRSRSQTNRIVSFFCDSKKLDSHFGPFMFATNTMRFFFVLFNAAHSNIYTNNSFVNLFQFHFYEVLFINLNFICHNLTFMTWSAVTVFFSRIEIKRNQMVPHRKKDSILVKSTKFFFYDFMMMVMNNYLKLKHWF